VLPRITSENGLGNAALRFYSGASFKGQVGWDQSADVLGLYGSSSSTAPALAIAAAGNVGIGTSSPTFAAGGGLNVVQSTFATMRARGGSSTGTDFAQDSSGNGYAYVRDNAAFIFGTNNTDRARIDSSGNLLVGTTSVLNGTGVQIAASNTAAGTVGGLFVRNTASSGADLSPALSVSKTMTTTSSDARFVQFFANNMATPMGGIVGNGASNVQFASISDIREKTNIQNISGSLQKIVALRPVEFDWIANGEHCPAGFVAQDVEQVFPEFVVENMANGDEESRKGLTGGMTGGIVAHLVKAIQEQQEQIEQLKADIAELKGA
jgi:hypothetical protein